MIYNLLRLYSYKTKSSLPKSILMILKLLKFIESTYITNSNIYLNVEHLDQKLKGF